MALLAQDMTANWADDVIRLSRRIQQNVRMLQCEAMGENFHRRIPSPEIPRTPQENLELDSRDSGLVITFLPAGGLLQDLKESKRAVDALLEKTRMYMRAPMTDEISALAEAAAKGAEHLEDAAHSEVLLLVQAAHHHVNINHGGKSRRLVYFPSATDSRPIKAIEHDSEDNDRWESDSQAWSTEAAVATTSFSRTLSAFSEKLYHQWPPMNRKAENYKNEDSSLRALAPPRHRDLERQPASTETPRRHLKTANSQRSQRRNSGHYAVELSAVPDLARTPSPSPRAWGSEPPQRGQTNHLSRRPTSGSRHHTPRAQGHPKQSSNFKKSSGVDRAIRVRAMTEPPRARAKTHLSADAAGATSDRRHWKSSVARGLRHEDLAAISNAVSASQIARTPSPRQHRDPARHTSAPLVRFAVRGDGAHRERGASVRAAGDHVTVTSAREGGLSSNQRRRETTPREDGRERRERAPGRENGREDGRASEQTPARGWVDRTYRNKREGSLPATGESRGARERGKGKRNSVPSGGEWRDGGRWERALIAGGEGGRRSPTPVVKGAVSGRRGSGQAVGLSARFELHSFKARGHA